MLLADHKGNQPLTFRYFFAYHSDVDTLRKSLSSIGFSAPNPERLDGAVIVAASIIAVIRLRGEELRPSPRLTTVIQDSVALARSIMREVQRR
jgi:hypothetical protein